MDFIYYHPQIFEFLKDYPQSKWPDLIISAILHGIPSLKRSQDSSPLPLLRQQLNSMREELEKLNKSLDEPKKSLKSFPKKLQPEQKAPKTPKKPENKSEETPRFSKQNPNSVSPSRVSRSSKPVSPLRGRTPNPTQASVLTHSSNTVHSNYSNYSNHSNHSNFSNNANLANHSIQTHSTHSIQTHSKSSKPPSRPRQIPKYLQNVDSKIKPEVQKDIAHYKSLVDSAGDDSIEKSSLSLIDLSEKETRKSSQGGGFFDSSMSKSNSFEVRLTNTLEGTFTNQEIVRKARPSTEIPIDRDFETPRYPTECHKESEILEIADNFLTGPLMAELCAFNERQGENSSRCIKSQQVPPLDLLSSEEHIMPFRKRWEEATKDIGRKVEEIKSKDFRLNTTSREFYSGRSSAMMMVQTPSPIPYDEKYGPMCQDASYSKY